MSGDYGEGMPTRLDETPIGTLSEDEILRRVLGRLGASDVAVGPGDDAAVLSLADARVVVTTDTLVHGPDFRLAWSSGEDLGAKAAAVNLADIAAMGARPVALFVALAMPQHTTIGFVEALADGLRSACDELAPGCQVAGGDLTVSDTLTVAVTAVGELGPGDRPVLRSGARPGDVVAVTGELGLAARGLDLLFSRFRDDQGRPLPVDTGILSDEERAAVSAQLRPRPAIGAGAEAARAGAGAMMDLSDGLVRDARRMARSSSVTIALESALLGPDVASALHGGEDHGLLATFPADAELPPQFRRIGSVTTAVTTAVTAEDPTVGTVTVDGVVETGIGGWDPYQHWDSAIG